MKSSHFLRGFLFLGAFSIGFSAAFAADSAVVKADRVNVRGKASLQGEVITQLRKGETVVVIEEVAASAKAGSSIAPWLKIAMPANTPVWVNAGHIDPAAKTVSVRRLNIRGGAGENFSILGTLDKGASVKEIRTVGDWMEIEAPTNTFGFVTSELVSRSGAPASASAPALSSAAPPVEKLPVKEVDAQPAEPPPATKPKQIAVPEPVVTPPSVAEPKPASETPPSVPVAPPVRIPDSASQVQPGVSATAAKDEPLPKRTISREGIVKRTYSIQAPGDYQLVGVENGRTLNYLLTRKLGFSLDGFGGRKIIVTGEELVDKRWPNTPIIDVETFRLVP